MWDMDGTLLDSFGIYVDILAEVVKQEGRVMPTREECVRHFHGSLEESIQNVLGIKSAEELALTIEKFLKIQENYYQGDVNAHLFNDATMLAQQAAKKNVKQLLVTNRAHINRGSASPRAIVAATVLADCIHEIRASDEVEFRKPDKRVVVGWLEANNISPDEVLVIGDQHVDAQLAANLDVRSLLVGREGDIPHLDMVESNTHKPLVVGNLHDVILN